MYQPSLCIDLGAAFTKIAYRDKPTHKTHLLRHPELNFDEQRFCVPSVAARNARTGEWVFGVEAMDYRPSESIEVYRNWKSDLFHPGDDRPMGFRMLEDASPTLVQFLEFTYPHLRVREVAVRYLRWLREEMIPAMLHQSDPVDMEVLLCVPEFVVRGSMGPIVEQLMTEAGYRNSGLFTVSEPKANLVGVLTEGRNSLTSRDRPSRATMFGGSAMVERFAMEGEGLLFIDIGAYTTDFALADLLRGPEQGFDEDPSESVPLGIRMLDDLVTKRLEEGMRKKVESLPPSGWERLHAVVYGGERHFASESEWAVDHDLTLPVDVVQGCVESFAEAVGGSVERFLAAHGSDHYRTAVLTGGGINLTAISNRLAQKLSGLGFETLFAPATVRVPAGMESHPLSQEVIRGASGIGGASILFAQP